MPTTVNALRPVENLAMVAPAPPALPAFGAHLLVPTGEVTRQLDYGSQMDFTGVLSKFTEEELVRQGIMSAQATLAATTHVAGNEQWIFNDSIQHSLKLNEQSNVATMRKEALVKVSQLRIAQQLNPQDMAFEDKQAFFVTSAVVVSDSVTRDVKPIPEDYFLQQDVSRGVIRKPSIVDRRVSGYMEDDDDDDDGGGISII